MTNKDINELLFEAASEGRAEDVAHYLSLGANINSVHTDLNATSLFAAVAYNYPEIVDLLLKNGADMELAVGNGATPLWKSVHSCHSQITKMLLDKGANTEVIGNGYVPMYVAISNECVEDVKSLLKAGAKIYSDDLSRHDIYMPLILNSFKYNQGDVTKEMEEIYHLVLNHYWDITANQVKAIEERTKNSTKTFQVVIVRYNEDVSWALKEFPNEKVIIFNKGPDDLIDLPDNFEVIKIPNLGYLGGTYLKYIIDNYYNLADITLFIQGHPYDASTFLPLIRYKEDLDTNCRNIKAKCVDTTLAYESDFLGNFQWDNSARYKDFVPRNLSMIDYTHKYIGNIPLDETFYVTYGAIFAVLKEKILNCDIEHYQAMLPIFNYIKPMADHCQERLWDPMFEYCSGKREYNKQLSDSALNENINSVKEALTKGADTRIKKYNNQLFDGALNGDIDSVKEALTKGADINSIHGDVGASPLFAAIAYNHTNTVQVLLDNNADLELTSNANITPLFKAAHSCYSDITSILLNAGAYKNKLSNGVSPLYAAISSRCVKDVEILLNAGALTYYDNNIDNENPLLLASYLSDAQESDTPEKLLKSKIIYKLVEKHYLKWLDNNLTELTSALKIDESKSFEVVVVRYKENLSWIKKEFPNEKITIYNKGDDDLSDLPANCKVIKIPNVGWFGGTILYHLENEYYNLADRTVFLQGNPYAQYVPIPLINFKSSVLSPCQNIQAKCINTTLKKQSDSMGAITPEDWNNSKYGKCFKLSNSTMIDFFKENIDQDIDPESALAMVWGAQFAVNRDEVHRHHPKYYQKKLPLFNEQCPIDDFSMEKGWNPLFNKASEKLNLRLQEAALEGNNELVIKALEAGADINSKYLNKGTPLFLAVRNNHIETVRLLIELKADVNIPLTEEESPIWYAAYHCYPEIGKLLIQANADIMQSKEYTPLYTAISEGCVEMVDVLLQAGADLLHEEKGGELQTPILLADFRKNNKEEAKFHEIHSMVMNHYYKWLNDSYNDILKNINIDESKSFEVVVIRYKEDLSWIQKEFPHENVTILNKGPDDLHDLPANCKVINISNEGYYGGTILKYIVDNYENLADRILFLQGDPYDAKIFLPLINYKGNNIKSTCKNIIGKCVSTTLADASEYFKIWFKVVLPNSKYSDVEVPEYNMIDYVHNKIDHDFPLYDNMRFVWGAEFAIDKDKILINPKEKYADMLSLFPHKKAGVDFYQEQSWDISFQRTTTELNALLSNATLNENIDEIVHLIELGADAARFF